MKYFLCGDGERKKRQFLCLVKWNMKDFVNYVGLDCYVSVFTAFGFISTLRLRF